MKRLFEVCPAARQVTVQAKRRIEPDIIILSSDSQ